MADDNLSTPISDPDRDHLHGEQSSLQSTTTEADPWGATIADGPPTLVDPWSATIVDPSSLQASGGASPSLQEQEGARYVSESVLGEGGMGQVILVHDQSIDRQVAMKKLKPLHNQASRLRFIEEARIIGQLEHPSIVPIHDVGVDEQGAYFFIMKKVEGETLYDIIKRLKAGDETYHARYNFETRIQIFLGILNAIHFAHDRGFIHRDIKPENIMIGPFGEVMVMDWGLAKRISPHPSEASSEDGAEPGSLEESVRALDAITPGGSQSADFGERIRLTHQGELLGTPAYMAPEQAIGDHANVDMQTDVFALGVLLHELLTLEHYLASKDSLLTLLYGVCNETFSPREVKPHPSQGLPPAEYIHICKHAMQKDKALRYESVAALISAIHIAQSGQFPCECPVTFARRANNVFIDTLSNHPLVLIAGLILVPLLVISALVIGLIGIINIA